MHSEGQMNDKIPFRFPEALRARRMSVSMSQQELAARIGVDPAYLCALEKGRRVGPDEYLVKKISAALSLTREDEDALRYHARNDLLIKLASKLLPRAIGLYALEAVLTAFDELEDEEMAGLLAHIRSLTSSKRALKQLVSPKWEVNMT